MNIKRLIREKLLNLSNLRSIVFQVEIKSRFDWWLIDILIYTVDFDGF